MRWRNEAHRQGKGASSRGSSKDRGGGRLLGAVDSRGREPRLRPPDAGAVCAVGEGINPALPGGAIVGLSRRTPMTRSTFRGRG